MDQGRGEAQDEGGLSVDGDRLEGTGAVLALTVIALRGRGGADGSIGSGLSRRAHPAPRSTRKLSGKYSSGSVITSRSKGDARRMSGQSGEPVSQVFDRRPRSEVRPLSIDGN